MNRFATKKIKSINGVQRFEQLVILSEKIPINIDLDLVDGIWDSFKKELEDKYQDSFIALEKVMIKVAKLESLSSNRFKDITPAKDQVKEFEFKYQDLRAYGIKIPNGKLIILGGYKNNQFADIKKFRGLKRKILEFFKNDHQ